MEMSVSYELPDNNPILPQDDFFFTLMSSMCAFPGGYATYTYNVYIPTTFRNPEATNIVVTDKLPEGFTATACSSDTDNVTHQYDEQANTITWTIKSIQGSGTSHGVSYGDVIAQKLAQVGLLGLG